MLPRLEAERELTTINAMSAAFGGMRRADRDRYIGRLRRAASGGGKPTHPTPETLAAMGVAVVMVPAKGKASGTPRSGQEADRSGDPNG